MKRVMSLMIVSILLVMSVGFYSFADPDSGSLSDVIGSQSSQTTDGGNGTTVIGGENTQPQSNTPTQVIPSQTQSDTQAKNAEFAAGLSDAAGLASADVGGAEAVNAGIKKVAAWIVRILSYFIVAFLVVRVVVDICYITLPFTRTFLANGYAGTPQTAANGMQPGMQGSMMGGMPGMGMGMGYHNRGYGMNSGMGMGMNNGMAGGMAGGMASGMGMQNTMGNQGQSMMGRIQFVSTPALNAVASESALGPNNKSSNALKIYAKDMVVVLVATPILLILAATGVLTSLGFTIANVLVDGISKIGGML